MVQLWLAHGRVAANIKLVLPTIATVDVLWRVLPFQSVRFAREWLEERKLRVTIQRSSMSQRLRGHFSPPQHAHSNWVSARALVH